MSLCPPCSCGWACTGMWPQSPSLVGSYVAPARAVRWARATGAYGYRRDVQDTPDRLMRDPIVGRQRTQRLPSLGTCTHDGHLLTLRMG
jgi:hypothetical protein